MFISRFAENLRKLRKDSRKTQEELGKLVGLASNTIGHYESGRSEPDFSTLVEFAKIFDVNLDELLGAEDYLDKKRLT